MLAALTGTGLSAAAGLNAYIPFLIVALLDRFTSVVTLPEQFAWISSWWAIALGSLLLVSEVVLDKIAVVDHINDAVGTVIRPLSGGVIFAATQSAADLDQSQWMADNPWLGWGLGIAVAGVVHATKATARPFINAATVGVGTPVVSTAEDGASIGLSLVAVFLPVLVIVALVLLAWAAFWVFRRARRARRRYDGLGERMGTSF